MSVAPLLKSHDVFQALTVDEVDRLSRFSSKKHLAAGEWAFRPGEPATHLFVLLAGRIQLRLRSAATESSLPMAKIDPGDFLGLSALLEESRYNAGAQCLAASDVLVIEAKPLRGLLLENPRVGFAVMTAVARGYSERYTDVLRRLHGILE